VAREAACSGLCRQVVFLSIHTCSGVITEFAHFHSTIVSVDRWSLLKDSVHHVHSSLDLTCIHLYVAFSLLVAGVLFSLYFTEMVHIAEEFDIHDLCH
jgi:hypothetical protein